MYILGTLLQNLLSMYLLVLHVSEAYSNTEIFLGILLTDHISSINYIYPVPSMKCTFCLSGH